MSAAKSSQPRPLSQAVRSLSAVALGWGGAGAAYGVWVAARMELAHGVGESLLTSAYVGLAFALLGSGLTILRGGVRLGLALLTKKREIPKTPPALGQGILAALGAFILIFALLLAAGDLLLTLAFQASTPRWWLGLRVTLILLSSGLLCWLLAGPLGQGWFAKIAPRLGRLRHLVLPTLAALILLTACALPWLGPGPSARSKLGQGAGTRVQPKDTGLRVVLLGLDGASWRVMDQLMAQGKLPQTKALLNKGVRATPISPPPHASPITWTTIVTGQEPAQHGIHEYLLVSMPGLTPFPFEALAHDLTVLPFSFVTLAYFLGGVASGIPPTSDLVQVESIWHRLSAGGRESLVLGIPCTWPARAMRGLLVSDRYGPNEFDMFTHLDGPLPDRVWPPEAEAGLHSQVVDSAGDPRPMVDALGGLEPEDLIQLSHWSYNPLIPTPLHLLTDVYDADMTFLNILQHELSQKPYAFSIVLINGLDLTMHAFWAFRFPEHFGLARSQRPSWGQLIDGYHKLIDQRLSEVLRAAGEDAVVILLSDSGMGPSPNNPIWPGWHHPQALFLAAGGPILPGAQLRSMDYRDLAPTILYLLGFEVPRELPGRVLEEMIDPQFRELYPLRQN